MDRSFRELDGQPLADGVEASRKTGEHGNGEGRHSGNTRAMETWARTRASIGSEASSWDSRKEQCIVFFGHAAEEGFISFGGMTRKVTSTERPISSAISRRSLPMTALRGAEGDDDSEAGADADGLAGEFIVDFHDGQGCGFGEAADDLTGDGGAGNDGEFGVEASRATQSISARRDSAADSFWRAKKRSTPSSSRLVISRSEAKSR